MNIKILVVYQFSYLNQSTEFLICFFNIIHTLYEHKGSVTLVECDIARVAFDIWRIRIWGFVSKFKVTPVDCVILSSASQNVGTEFFGSKLWYLPVDNSRQRLLVDFSIRWICSGLHHYNRKLTSALHNVQGSSKNASYSTMFIDHQFERFWLTSWAVKRFSRGGERCVSLQASKYAFPWIIQRYYVYSFYYNNFR